MSEHSARHLRRILALHLTEWGLPGLTDDAGLALTELVANVVRHVPDRRCGVRIFRTEDGKGVRVEVEDAHPELPKRRTCQAEPAEDGRGLVILDALASRWGVGPRPQPGPGKTVWFECDTAG
ncbi:ATP-binding protein [Streptomyces sp. VRA16 Mangrove soil]|uniref:ATP-binding protein n=1 Tax=Streptomyces sp. VRA16 Mangrove soil TaxID=2817434 RepID=UPI001A9E2D5F|nr:ATP-binding protein [Streptomyces sp. VRA16 Mangrove soil]MBO1337421.1 ATP-binding protein [Streptomyces sp. VRA16 Mangrove soil]